MASNLDGASEGFGLDSQASDFDRIAEVSLLFENKWTPERDFSIEDALAFAPERESMRRELFALLLEIDMTRGFETNSSTPTEEYVRRFPRWKKIVESSAREIARDFQNASVDRIGKWVGDYRIDEELGQGGTGCVYKAFDRSFQRSVALKFLKTADDQNEERLKLFRREIVAMGQIPPGSIFAQAYSCDLDDGVAYLVMEYVDGIDLQRYFKNADGRREKAGPLDWREATDYVAQIASGLITIHGLGIAHRDVKPANVMLDAKGKIRVLDLGFADFYGTPDGLDADSKEKMIAGTRAFLAPEARYGQQALDARSDLYCLGGTYLYLLTGLVPSDRFDPFSNKTPIPMRDFLSMNGVELPDPVVDVLERLLQPDREKRCPTAQDAWNDLNALIAQKPSIRKKLAFVALFVALLAATLGPVVYNVSGAKDRARFSDAVAEYVQGNLDRAFAIVQTVRCQKLPIAVQPQYWILSARGYIRGEEFSKVENSLKLAFETIKRLPSSADAFVQEFEARALEAEALVLQGEKSVKENPDKATRVLNEANEKVADFFEKRGALDATLKNKTKFAVAAVHYWRARSYQALRDDNNIEIVLPELDACLQYNPNFRDARSRYGDLLSEQARRGDSEEAEYKQYYAREAALQYESAASRSDSTFDEKCGTLRKTILLCEFLGEQEAELKACEQLLKIDPQSRVARRYRGRIELFKSLAESPNSVEASKKDKILDDLRAVATKQNYWSLAAKDEDRWSRLTNDETSVDQKKGEIWIEIALAELKLGSSQNYDKCVSSVEKALSVNNSQSVYVFDGIEYDTNSLLREAYEKKLEICETDDDRRYLESKIKELKQKEIESKGEVEVR